MIRRRMYFVTFLTLSFGGMGIFAGDLLGSYTAKANGVGDEREERDGPERVSGDPLGGNCQVIGTQASSSSRFAVASCPRGRTVVSGGCWSPIYFEAPDDGVFVGSYPFENGSIYDYPDNGEDRELVDGTNGWVCEIDLVPGHYAQQNTGLIAEALCCS